MVALWSQMGPFEDNVAAVLGLRTHRMVDRGSESPKRLIVLNNSSETI